VSFPFPTVDYFDRCRITSTRTSVEIVRLTLSDGPRAERLCANVMQRALWLKLRVRLVRAAILAPIGDTIRRMDLEERTIESIGEHC